jgi:hypothetical protein
LVVGGAENRLAAIALQNPSTGSCHALRATQQRFFWSSYWQNAMRVILF